MLSYKEQLQHPLWQRKRLEILERDNFKCRMCGDDESQLQVHHVIYMKDAHVWEYNNSLLLTLCNQCHEIETKEKGITMSSFRFLIDLCNLCDKSISEVSYIYPKIYDMVYNENYEYNEAFKISILELINKS
jgi:hypothetical protein